MTDALWNLEEKFDADILIVLFGRVVYIGHLTHTRTNSIPSC